MAKEHDDSINPTRRKFFKTCAGGAAAAMLGGQPRASAAEAVAGEAAAAVPVQPPSPEWTRDLIIYEIATKGFTSPHGPESGNFNSFKAKLPYLQDLGITGIWLTGYSLCDPHHFYNIWTQYAVIEPDKLDPSLGTEREFASLIAEAHRRGIKIFLDVITHGLMAGSPVIQKHPAWFQGGSWGMVDFDWFGGHADLDEWWVNIWTNYVTKYGVDGYRLDVAIYRPDLWERIRRNAAAAGHPIVIFEESDAVIPGITDFTQRENPFFPAGDPRPSPKIILARDVAGFFDRKFGKAGHYQVEIQYADDGSTVKGFTDGHGDLRVHFKGLTADKTTPRWWTGMAAMPDGIPDVQLTVENAQERPIERIVVSDDMGGRWERGVHPMMTHHVAVAGAAWPAHGSLTGKPSLQLYVATLAHGWPSVMLSCHDNGWEGFPLDKNPYGAHGSRALFGYSCLFTPMIPIFFSGEEFDAAFRPLPGLSPHLYGGKEPGKGRWLYGSMLDWNQLRQAEHHAMFEDVKSMIAVRKREADVLAVPLEQAKPNLMAVPCEHNITAPVPYIRWKDRRAIVVAANCNRSQEVRLKLQIPLEEIGLAGHASYRVTDLWPGGEAKTYSEQELESFACTVGRDGTRGGGLRVFRIEPNL
ncbi:MAG TPA: alpha-amylase family glycosyl hydrolase [Terriglobia bacterium]|nr:alpha-amylase family glycosyl hydrolase [Terriglobia bacterium]